MLHLGPTLFLVLFTFIPITPALGQEGAGGEPAAPAAQTIDDPAIPLDDLVLLLTPLRKAELEVELEGWMGLLEAKVRELKELERRIKYAEDDEKTRLVDQATTSREQRTGLIDRVGAAIEALREKGGDVEEYEKYIAAVSGIALDATDVSATWNTVRGWIESKEGGVRWGLNILKFLVTLIAFWIISRILGGVTRRAVSSLKKTSELLRDFFINSVRKITFFIGIVIALSMLEVDIGPFLAAIGAVGFVVGFALQGTLSNFASGVMILLYRPYDIGDAVTVSGVTGQVSAMSLVSTLIRTFDNQDVVVPNSSIWGGIITNITANPTRRVDMTFGIGYSDDIDKAQKIIEEILANHPKVLDDPAPLVKVNELADSSVNLIVRPWTKKEDYGTVFWDVTKAVKERFDKAGISIPFPQRDIHVYKDAVN